LIPKNNIRNLAEKNLCNLCKMTKSGTPKATHGQSRHACVLTDLRWLGLCIILLVAMSICIYILFSPCAPQAVTVETFPSRAPLFLEKQEHED
jgi:hypothetical protein